MMPNSEQPKSILAEAAQVVQERMAKYGSPSVNHTRTAQMWSAFLGIPITPQQVCWLNVLQKISREVNTPQRDSKVDVVGFVRNIELIDEAAESKHV